MRSLKDALVSVQNLSQSWQKLKELFRKEDLAEKKGVFLPCVEW
jgi:hypothetical protein